jgi:hypothetical protein
MLDFTTTTLSRASSNGLTWYKPGTCNQSPHPGKGWHGLSEGGGFLFKAISFEATTSLSFPDLSTGTNPNPEPLFPRSLVVVFFQMFQFISGHFAFSDSNPRPKANLTYYSVFSSFFCSFDDISVVPCGPNARPVYLSMWPSMPLLPLHWNVFLGRHAAATCNRRESRTPSKPTSTPTSTPAPSETFNTAHR